MLPIRFNIPSSHILQFTQRLTNLIQSGLTLPRSLSILINQTPSPKLKEILRDINRQISQGRSFSSALHHQNGTFSPVYKGMVHVGETSGKLDEVLHHLSTLLQSEEDIKVRFRNALIYPILVVVLALTLCFFLMVYVIPRFELLFLELGSNLPLPTQILLMGSTVLTRYHWLWIGLVIVGIGGLVRWRSIFWGKCIKRWIKFPLIGEWIQSYFLERWCRFISLLLKSGLALLDAVVLSKNVVGSGPFFKETEVLAKRIHEGMSFSHALRCSPVFPPLLGEMVELGEESGNLEQVLAKLSETYKKENEQNLKFLFSVFEPTLLLGVGFMVGFMAICLLLPIFEMSSQLQ